MSKPDDIVQGVRLFQQAQQLRAAAQPARAARAYAQALERMPAHPALLLDYAQFSESCQDWQTAEQLYRRLGELRPDSQYEGALGICLFRQDRFEEAVPWLRKHSERHPQELGVKLALAQSLLKLLDYEAALPLGEQLLAERPGSEAAAELVVNCRYNLGFEQVLDQQLESTLAAWPRSPLIQALLGFHLLKKHDFARGFGFQQAIRRRYQSGKPDMNRPDADGWNGQRFNGLLLIDGEQGLGEEILAASMFADLEAMGQEAVISCDARLIPLFARSFPALRFVDRAGEELDRLSSGADRIHRFAALDLACVLRRKPFTNSRPWLRPDPDRVAGLKARYDQHAPGMRHFGISWRTVRDIGNVPRSIRLIELADLLRLDDIYWFNTQYGDYTDDVAALAAAAGIAVPWDDLGVDQTNDIDGLAAQLCAFDGLVSISNTTVHLAGALGVPSWLLLPKTRPVMWYWGYSGERTPWYPSVHIVRNREEQRWQALAAQLAKELSAPTTPEDSP